MRSIDIGVGHDDDFVIAQLRRVEIILTNTCTERGDHSHDFLMREHLVVSRFLDVENLSLDRQDCLSPSISTLLCGTPGRITLNDEYLCTLRGALLAIREFTGKRHAVEGTLSPDQLTCPPRRLSSA